MIVSARTFAVLAALACGLMSACGSLARESTPSGGSGDSPIYASVSALARQSDAILVVEVGAVASREFDNGGDDSDGDPGVPMVFWHAEVVDVLVGQWGEEPGEDIRLAWPDVDREPNQDRSRLSAGQVIVLFAKRLTPVDAPGIDTQEVFYVPLGGDNGVLDLEGHQATARSDALVSVSDPEGDTHGRLSASLVDITEAIAHGDNPGGQTTPAETP